MAFEVESDWKTSTDKQALVRYASVLGVKTDGRTGIEAIRKQIAETLGESLSESAELEEQPPKKVTGAMSFGRMKKLLQQHKKYVVIMPSTESDPWPAEGGVNGVMFVVKRDVEQILPEPMVRVFQKSVKTTLRWDNEKMRNVPVRVPMYPITVVREATEEDLEDERLSAQNAQYKQRTG